jgi:predicted enzyme related to lactoylglutathione lyase
VRIPSVESRMGGTIVYFSVVDCTVEAQRAAENGGKVHKPKFSLGEYGHLALVYNSEGNMIGLHSMK